MRSDPPDNVKSKWAALKAGTLGGTGRIKATQRGGTDPERPPTVSQFDPPAGWGADPTRHRYDTQ